MICYLLLRSLARIVLHLFFRRIEIEGLASVSKDAPVLFAPNHSNAFVDPLVLMIALPRRLTLTAKNVLANNPLAAAFMAALGVILFHRKDDVGKGADPRQNLRSLERRRDVLDRGGALCIFPEGVSHSDPSMRRFRTGAARIALDCLKSKAGARPLIVPVGLLYTEKHRFRSNVWLRFGPPLSVERWQAEHPEADAHDLTEEIRRRVEALTLNFEARRESLILTWGAEIMVTRGQDPPPLGWRDPFVANWFQLVARLRDGYRALLDTHPAEVAAVTTRVRHYRSQLKRLGIEPAEVYLPVKAGKALFFVVRELELLLIGAPFALFGAVNHLLPYLIVKKFARVLSKDKDHWATNVIYPSFVVFPLFFLLQVALAWLLVPPFWAGLYTIALPYTGYVALLYFERARATRQRIRSFVYFLRNPAKQEELAREGRDIIAAVWALESRLHMPAKEQL